VYIFWPGRARRLRSRDRTDPEILPNELCRSGWTRRINNFFCKRRLLLTRPNNCSRRTMIDHRDRHWQAVPLPSRHHDGCSGPRAAIGLSRHEPARRSNLGAASLISFVMVELPFHLLVVPLRLRVRLGAAPSGPVFVQTCDSMCVPVLCVLVGNKLFIAPLCAMNIAATSR
jgi:hypothetical protein